MTDSLPKQKVSLSLDADVVAELEKSGPLSPQVNDALRAEFERRRQEAALQRLVMELTEKYGPLDTPEDLEAIGRYAEMLS
jgi:hypothetical protein